MGLAVTPLQGGGNTGTGGEPVPALAFRNLSKHFGGERALNAVNLTIKHGEVHGLLGQNGSGKSTLIKILAGYHAPDPGGELWIKGEPVRLPLQAGQFRQYGIAFVHQDLGLVPSLTVVENLFVGALASQGAWRLSHRQEEDAAEALFDRFGVDIDPTVVVGRLSPVQRALLAIIRAVEEMRQSRTTEYDGCLLVLDEPTPFLPRHDVNKLFDLVREIVARGASVIFVSHDVDEVLEITDRATVLRDGDLIDTVETKKINKQDLIQMIVGQHLKVGTTHHHDFSEDGALVDIHDLTGPQCQNIDLRIHAGEILGLTGLIGSGYDEVLYLLYGAVRAKAGMLRLGQKHLDVRRLNPQRAIAEGIVLVPGDRQNAGAVGELTVTDNLSLPLLDKSRGGWRINWGVLAQQSSLLIDQFQVRPNRPDLPFRALSGGNQQKVLLAKWFQISPRFILLDEPTQGVDVGARQQVFDAVRKATGSGAAVICASSDYEQLATLCDRVVIFSRGRIISQLVGEAISKEAIAEVCYQSLESSVSA